ncbi:MAG: hypothetical protein D6761_00690 [Candidatus Dadabacteria bacterium]|nr:MAG: hypothetical protein D6761_00690 [Candidatus Dadabacteria bacterium]
MTDIRMRPGFAIPARNPNAILDRLETLVARDNSAFRLQRYDGHAILHVRHPHIWSPHLSISVHQNDDEQPELACRFEPSSNIWTLFMAAYLIAGFGAFISFCWGMGQWLAGESPVALWGAVIGTLLVTNTYAFSLFGRALGFDDMYRLRAELDEAVQQATET